MCVYACCEYVCVQEEFRKRGMPVVRIAVVRDNESEIAAEILRSVGLVCVFVRLSCTAGSILHYGVATISRLLKITGLFCRI